MSAARSFSQTPRLSHLSHLVHIATVLGMGRQPWATPAQLEYLRSWLPHLPRAKKTTGLQTAYIQAYEGFLVKWQPEPIVPVPDASPEQLAARAKKKLLNRIVNWFKEERKKAKLLALPRSETASRVLDLSGKSRRKKPPYQLHQAFSILHWKPQDSPLRREVQDLWERRNEDSVRELLMPFLNEAAKSSTTSSEKLVFHVAVMRWKCSLLNADELATLRDWIEEQRKAKQNMQALPWSLEATEYGDELFAENNHIQRSIDDLPSTVQLAIEEIERQTGWKAMVILGGLEPKVGKISSHLYMTGSSRDTRKSFQEAYPEVTQVRTLFHEWLRTVYSDEEKAKRTSHNTVSVISITAPSHTNMDTTAGNPTMSPSSANSPFFPSSDVTLKTPSLPVLTISPSSANSSSFPPLGVTLETPSLPVLSPTREGSVDHLIPENDSGSRSEMPSPSQAPPSFHDDTSNDPLPALSPPSRSRMESPIPFRSSTPTPGIIPAPLPLSCAESGMFDPAGVRGDFISKSTCVYWESVPGGAKWAALVKSYLELEVIPPLKGQPRRITTVSRPKDLQAWLKSGRRLLEKVPTIASAPIYGSEWVEWWTAAQPQERETHQWPFPRETISDMGWSKFPANGKDGIFLAVMGLSWWAPAIKSSSDVALFEEAVTDIHWVVQELIRIRMSLTSSPPLPPSQDEPNPHQPNRTPSSKSSSRTHTLPSGSQESAPGARGHPRGEGKRVVKPTWKVAARR